MAQEVNIYQLLGACTSLDAHFSSDVEDEVDEYSDVQSKLELAQQLESDLHDPEGEWETLHRTVSRVSDSARYIERLVDNAYRLGREEAESAADDDNYKVWSAMLQSNPMQKALMEQQKGTAERDNTIKTTLTVLTNMSRKQDEQDERIQGLQADLEEWERNHDGCSVQGDIIADLEQQLNEWKDHGDCATRILALEEEVKAHEGCNETIQSLKQQLNAWKDHGDCVRVIDELKANVHKEQDLDARKQVTDMNNKLATANREKLECEEKLGTFERDIKSLYDLVIQNVNVGVERTDEEAKAKYKALAAKLQSWSGENIGTPSVDPARKASFRDLVKSLVNFDHLVKYHRDTIGTLNGLTTDITALHDTLLILRRDRDEWKDDCMAVVAKLESNEEAATARETALIKSVKECEALILELQQMIEDDLNST